MECTKFSFARLASILVLMSFAVTLISAKSKYYDGENKPYSFGFNIEGEQHRREMKDENGIIMGEYGFITADGVYHVTVYATDENGNFKILSMKNIRLGAAPNKPPPNATPITQFTTKPPNKQLDQPQADAPAPPPPPPTTPRPPVTTARPLPVAACSHCIIPSKAPPVEVPPPQEQQYQPPQNQQFQTPQQQNQYQPQQQNQYQPQQQQNQYPQTPSTDLVGPFGQAENELPQGDQPANQFNQPQVGTAGVQDQQNDQPKPGQYDTPLLISVQMSTADREAADQPLRPGEKPGLPNGITESDMGELLYRFNYTVGFHGHAEKGYSNGAKVGEYYVNYRNGFADKISYVADENGYRPKLETVKLTPEETPNPETEQNEEYGLKGYEFKWFYVPKYHYLNQH